MIMQIKQTKSARGVANQMTRLATETFVQRMLSGDMKLISNTIDATVFIVDIHDVANCLNEFEPPEAIIKLDSFYANIQQMVHESGGIVNQCGEDSITTIFCSPEPQHEAHAHCAISVAYEVMEQLVLLNKWRVEHKLRPVHIGLGVNSGDMVVDNKCDKKWHQLRIRGEAVDIATKFSFLNRHTPVHTIFLGHNTVQGIQNQNGWLIEPLRSDVEIGETAVSIYALMLP